MSKSKKILGLDLGTTSVGWAFVEESDDQDENKIIKTGVRLVPLTTDEKNNYEKGKSITTTADRTLKRSMRRNKDRYKIRRNDLITELKKVDFIDDNTSLNEDSEQSTHETYRIRAKAAKQKVTKQEFARILLAINKKRGYKSSRKVNNDDEGELIDGMAVAKKLMENNQTPGEFALQSLNEGKKTEPSFYGSDLQAEFNTIWDFQKQFYPEILTVENKEALYGKNKGETRKFFENKLEIERAENKKDQKLNEYQWRSKAIFEQQDIEVIAYILTELNNKINQSSGYLNAISDKSKRLFFNGETVGEYQYRLLKEKPKPYESQKNMVFYRQDYENEFEKIWSEQSKHYSELTSQLKDRIKKEIIFYQRRLKSQKGIVSTCEFEGVEKQVTTKAGVTKKKLIGPNVVPKSSPLFQAFRIWQNINSLRVFKIVNPQEKFHLNEDQKNELFSKLMWKEKMSKQEFLKWLASHSDCDKKEWNINFNEIQGNRSNEKLLSCYEKILLDEGCDNINFKKSSHDLIADIKECFATIGIDPNILNYNFDLENKEIEEQPSFKLWHLLYSYESDGSATGDESLKAKLKEKFGFKEEHAKLISAVAFEQDYGGLSAKAIKKILPHLMDGCEYDEACKRAGYSHANSLTKEENQQRPLKDQLELLKKNSLRNPVVEKILNQVINVVNAILKDDKLGRPDEIRIELARELKKTIKQRETLTKHINKATKEHEALRNEIKDKFNPKYVSRKDLIKYKLYKELSGNGCKTLYTNTKIDPDKLFTNTYDVDHIIPQSKLFDDSFSNKTLALRDVNIEKGNQTAIDYVASKYGEEGKESYKKRVLDALKSADGIKKSKKDKLFINEANIPEGFLNRDIGNTSYISRKAMDILQDVTKSVVPTSGTITQKLREDWGLIDVLKELSWDKYDQVEGMTYFDENNEGKKLSRIKEWSKRNDHRHHAMDAIAIAFTKRAYIQYLNNEEAKSAKGWTIDKIADKFIERDKYNKKRFIKPFEKIREESKKHLSETLISHKAKNKVTTKNINRTKIRGKNNFKSQEVQTPRGFLHMETVYGNSKKSEETWEKLGSNFDKNKIKTVTRKDVQQALLDRLEQNGNDPKKAFTGANSLQKKPIQVNGFEITEKVKVKNYKDQFTIRKQIDSDLNIDKIIDRGTREKVKERLDLYKGNKKDAFSNLEEDPIWLNKEKGIDIKRVTISGVDKAEPLHSKKDHFGQSILDDQGKEIPNDFVSLGSNHHIAIYEDEKGNLHEEPVSFYEAVSRKVIGSPIINKNHEQGWKFKFTMKQNEMFVFPNDDFDVDEIDYYNPKNKNRISKHLFRVQKIASKDYFFRHHLETNVENIKELNNTTWIRSGLKGIQGIKKIRLNHLGDIVHVGEY